MLLQWPLRIVFVSELRTMSCGIQEESFGSDENPSGFPSHMHVSYRLLLTGSRPFGWWSTCFPFGRSGNRTFTSLWSVRFTFFLGDVFACHITNMRWRHALWVNCGGECINRRSFCRSIWYAWYLPPWYICLYQSSPATVELICTYTSTSQSVRRPHSTI